MCSTSTIFVHSFDLEGKLVEFGMAFNEEEIKCFNFDSTMRLRYNQHLAKLLVGSQCVGNYNIVRLRSVFLMYIKVGQIKDNINQTVFLELNQTAVTFKVIVMSINHPISSILNKLSVAQYYQQCPLYYECNCEKYARLLTNEDFITKFYVLREQQIDINKKNSELNERESDLEKERHGANTVIVSNGAYQVRLVKAHELLKQNLYSKQEVIDTDLSVVNSLCDKFPCEKAFCICALLPNMTTQQFKIDEERKQLDDLAVKICSRQNTLDMELRSYERLCNDVELKRVTIASERLSLDYFTKQSLVIGIAELDKIANQ